MNYHDANINITSIPNEGSSITLEFKKAADAIKRPIEDIAVSPKINFKTPAIMAASLLLLLGVYSSIKINKADDFITETNDRAVILEAMKMQEKEPKLETKLQIASSNSQAFKESGKLDALIDMETDKLGLDLDSF